MWVLMLDKNERRRLQCALKKTNAPTGGYLSMLDGRLLRYINSGTRLIKVAVLHHLPEYSVVILYFMAAP